MTYLLDTNVLIGLAWQNHDDHLKLKHWMKQVASFATCPITQGGFVRISSNPAIGFSNGPTDAFRALDMILADSRHVFWPDDLSFGGAEVRRELMRGHTQITDKYLVALAWNRRGSVATLDVGLAKAFATEPPLVTLIGRTGDV